MVLRGLEEALPALPRDLEPVGEPHGPLPARRQQRVHGAFSPFLVGCVSWFGWWVMTQKPSHIHPIHTCVHQMQRNTHNVPVLDRLELDGPPHHGRPGLVDQAQALHRPCAFAVFVRVFGLIK